MNAGQMAADGDDDEDDVITPGEMVSLLLYSLRQHGADSPAFEAFLERFSADNPPFRENLSEVFVCAVNRQSVQLAGALLKVFARDIDINHRSQHIPGGDCALTSAARSCNVQLLDLLLKHEAVITVTTVSGETALDLVCERGSSQCTQLILDRLEKQRLDPEARDFVCYNGLMAAAYNCHDEILDLFISRGIDVNLNMDDDLGTPLHRAIGGGSLSCVDRLLRAGADVESLRRKVEQTPLMRAAEFGHVDIVCRLLAEGAKVNRMTKECSPALTLACHNGHSACVTCLIDHGADVNQKNPWGYTPLFMGADTPEIVRILVQSGAELDVKCGERGEAAIHLAAVIGFHDTVRILLANGADVDVLTDYDETALWLAVCKRHVDVTRLLLQHNCRMGVPSNGCEVFAYDYVELELAMGLDLFPITRMLLMAGCPLVNPVYYRPLDPGPVDAIPWVRLRPEALEIQRAKDGQFRWLVEFVSNARTLVDICTLYIRSVIGVPLEPRLRTLPLPEDVISYVCLKHI